jgi:hypothetical protein
MSVFNLHSFKITRGTSSLAVSKIFIYMEERQSQKHSQQFAIRVSSVDENGSPKVSFEAFQSSFSELIRHVLSKHTAVVLLPPKIRNELIIQWEAYAAKHDGRRVAENRKSIENISDLKNTLILTTRGAAGVTAVRLGGADTTYKIFLEAHQILLTAGRIFGIAKMEEENPCQVDSRFLPETLSSGGGMSRSASVDERFVEARATTANAAIHRRPHPWESKDRQNVLNLPRHTTATLGSVARRSSCLHRTDRTSGVFRKLFGRSQDSPEPIASPMPSPNIKPG